MKLYIISKLNKGNGHLTFGFYSSEEKASEDYNRFPFLEKEGYHVISVFVK